MQIKFIKFITLSIIFFIIVVFFISLNRTTVYDTKNLVGQKITNVKLDHFTLKKFVTEESFKKKEYTLINFWASWCAPCRVEHPLLIKLSEEKNLKLVGVNFKDKKSNALKFLKELGNPYEILAKDVSGKHSVNFGIYGIPESILVNKNLVIIKKFVGPISKNDYKYILTIINK